MTKREDKYHFRSWKQKEKDEGISSKRTEKYDFRTWKERERAERTLADVFISPETSRTELLEKRQKLKEHIEKYGLQRLVKIVEVYDEDTDEIVDYDIESN